MKKLVSLILTVTIIFGGSVFTAANQLVEVSEFNDYTNKIDENSEFYNSKYGKLLEEIKDMTLDQKKSRLVNSPSQYSFGESYVSNDCDSKNKARASESLASSYNNSLSPSYVKEFQDQGRYRDLSWAFAANATIEAQILRNNGTISDNKGFSEEHLMYCTSDETATDDYGHNRYVNGEGNFNMALSYWARENHYAGPIYDSYLKYDPSTGGGAYTTEYVDSLSKNKKYIVTDTVTLSSLKYGDDKNTRLNDIKRMIKDFGGVYVSYVFDKKYFNATHTAYYGDSGDIDNPVTLVGWNDNYSKDSFGQLKPSSNGAFLAVDSITSDDGNGIHYYYLSYDMVAGFSACSSVSGIENINPNNVVYENETRIDGESNVGNCCDINSNTNAFAEKFYISGNNIEELNSISTYCPIPNSYYKVYISLTGNKSDMKEVDVLGTKYENGYKVNNIGYHTFKLESPIEIDSNSFMVGFEVYNPLDNHTIPLCPGDISSQIKVLGIYAEDMNSIKTETGYENSNRLIIKANTTKTNKFLESVSHKMWRISDLDITDNEFVNNSALVDKSIETDSLTINANEEKYMSVDHYAKIINGVRYSDYLNLKGKGNADYRSLAFNVLGGCNIRVDVVAKSSDEISNRELAIGYLDENGNVNEIVNSISVCNVNVYTFNINESELGSNKLCLYSKGGGIHIYAIGYRISETDSASSKDNKEWIFDEDELAGYNNSNFITTDIKTSDGLTIKADDIYKVQIIDNNKSTDGRKYYRALNLLGDGLYERQLQFDIKKDMDMYITTMHTGDSNEIRNLYVTNEYGTNLLEDKDYLDITNSLQTYKISYNKSGDTVSLHSKNESIRIYSVVIVSRDENYDTYERSIVLEDCISPDMEIDYVDDEDRIFLIGNKIRKLYMVDEESDNSNYNYSRALKLIDPSPSYVESSSLRFYAFNSIETPTIIRCVCAKNSELILADKYHRIDTKYTGSTTDEIVFEYNGYATDLYLYTLSEAKIYKVSVSNIGDVGANSEIAEQLLNDNDNTEINNELDEISTYDSIMETDTEITSEEVIEAETNTEIISEKVIEIETEDITDSTMEMSSDETIGANLYDKDVDNVELDMNEQNNSVIIENKDYDEDEKIYETLLTVTQ